MKTRALLVLLLAAPGGLAGQAVSHASVRPDPGVRVHALEERYVVRGPDFRTVASLLSEMRIDGEGAPLSQGLTRYRLAPTWRYRPSGEACEVTAAEIDVEIEITLPRWEGAEQASEEDRRRWTEILADITRHEYRHRDLTVEAAHELARDLRAMSARTCSGLARAVEGKLAIAGKALEERHAAFDAVDSHRPR